jgi:3-hydroxyacyl-CoA dehydrogenase/enoyl-CoA hydratase/3-hydroxybutyryl-CoA epimerase
MPLVEIVMGKQSSANNILVAQNFSKKISKLPLKVLSKPGFLVNRVLAPYILEGILILEDGVPAQEIDNTMRKFGMPMGPLELADMVGLDICLSVGNILAQELDVLVPNILQQKVAKKQLGVKTNKGFYTYKNHKKQAPKARDITQHNDYNIEDRLVLRFLNEALECLFEKIVDTQNNLDAGMIFGTGFAPFRGGPVNYIHTIGKEKLLAKLQVLESALGEKFKASEGWECVT